MEKIAKAVIASQVGCSEIHDLLDSAAGAVMGINGGSAVPLWYTYLDGLAQAAPASGPVSTDDLKAMFASGLTNLAALSKAKVGDKTMMDALIPATEALRCTDGSIQELFSAAAAAADKGADDTKNYVSKFGRARSYGEQTLGTPDAGAVSMKSFFAGLAKDDAQ